LKGYNYHTVYPTSQENGMVL